MSASQERQPTLVKVAPRFLVGDMEQALAFYGQLGFATPYHDEGFAIVERDRIALQFNVSDPTHEPPQQGCRVCYISVTNIEALYQQYVPTGALRSPKLSALKTIGPRVKQGQCSFLKIRGSPQYATNSIMIIPTIPYQLLMLRRLRR